MRLRLFTYCVLQHPTKEELDKGVSIKMLIEPTNKLASDEKSLSMHIARALPEEVINKLEQIEIIIRPF